MQFAYTAVGPNANKTKGTIDADSRQDALRLLKQQGLYATALAERGVLNRRWTIRSDSVLKMDIRFGKPVKSGEYAMFTRQLATLIRAGVSIPDSVRLLSQQTTNRTFAQALARVSSELQSGNPFSVAMVGQPHIFSKVFINMTRAGEISGTLDVVLERLATMFEKEHDTREKVKSALTYPLVVAIVAVLVTTFLLVKVIPTFVGLFASFHAKLPLTTRIVLAASHFLTHRWYLCLLAMVIATIAVRVSLRYAVVRYWRDVFVLRMPVFGQLFRKSLLARFARTMGTLFASAVPILDALQLTAAVVNNEMFNRTLLLCADSLANGQRLSDPLMRSWVFPPMVTHMIRVGEETGNLDSMLEKVADFYERETNALVDRLKALIEPLMILFLAVIVGVIVSAVITPMFQIYQQVGNMG